jgi:hypothetical protein
MSLYLEPVKPAIVRTDDAFEVTALAVSEHSSPALPSWTGDPSAPKSGRKSFKPRGLISRLMKKETEAEKKGLKRRACAIALREWDGLIPVCTDGYHIALPRPLKILTGRRKRAPTTAR